MRLAGGGVGVCTEVGVFCFVLVPRTPPDSLVPTGAKAVAAVPGRGAVAGKNDCRDVAAHAGMVKYPVQFINGSWAESITNIGMVNGYPYHGKGSACGAAVTVPAAYSAVVGYFPQVVEAGDGGPTGWVEGVRDKR